MLLKFCESNCCVSVNGTAVQLLSLLDSTFCCNIFSSNNIAFFFLLAMLLPIKPSGALFSTWFGTLIWILMGFSMLKKNKL